MEETQQNEANLSFPTNGQNVAWVSDLQRRRMAGPRMKFHTQGKSSWRSSTKAIHAGNYQDPLTGAVGSPIFQATTFLFSDHTYDAFSEGVTRDFPIYTRYGNPNQWSVQEKIAALEGAESAAIFSSGMAAICTTLLALTNNGGHIVSSYDIYGGTFNFLREDMHQIGRSVTLVDPTDINAIQSAIKENTQVFFFESLSNPILKALPVIEIAKIAKENKILLVVDNTFLSPACSRLLDFGVDIVIHSCTKYLNGHSDVTAGVASGSRKYIDRIWAQMMKMGGSLDPFACFLLERGLKTLAIRMQAHSDNANALASFLKNHRKIVRVYHPSLSNYPYPWIREYCHGLYGGVVSFEVIGGDNASLDLLKHLSIPKVATSLGGVESLVSLPFNTSHSSLTEAQRSTIGIQPGLIRYSVGIEDINDLIEDLEQGLESIK